MKKYERVVYWDPSFIDFKIVNNEIKKDIDKQIIYIYIILKNI